MPTKAGVVLPPQRKRITWDVAFGSNMSQIIRIITEECSIHKDHI